MQLLRRSRSRYLLHRLQDLLALQTDIGSGPISSTSRFASGCGAEHAPGTMLYHPTNHVSRRRTLGQGRRTRRSDFGHDIAGDDVLGVAGGPLRLAFRSAPQRRWAVVGHPSAEGLWPRPHSGLLDPDTSPVRADILIFDCEFDGKRLLVSRVDARWVRTSWPLRVLAFRRVDSAYAVRAVRPSPRNCAGLCPRTTHRLKQPALTLPGSRVAESIY